MKYSLKLANLSNLSLSDFQGRLQEEYNSFRPLSSLGDLTPNEFIEKEKLKPEIPISECS